MSTVCVRTFSAVAVLSAAAAVFVGVRRERAVRARLAREAASSRLMAGCAHRDSEALRVQLEGFRRRMDLELAGREVVAEAGRVLDEALAVQIRQIDPEGGSR